MNTCALWGIMLGLAVAGCQQLGQNPPDRTETPPVARVGTAYLYQADLAQVLDQATSPLDSANIAQRFVNAWVKQQLLFQRAEAKAKLDLTELDRRVQEYRQQLLVYAYQQQYLAEHLDTLVTPAQINEYYAANPANFELKQNIVQAWLVALPSKTPNLAKARQWLRSTNPDDLDQFRTYALSYGQNPHLQDTTWVTLDELTTKTPFASQGQAGLLARGRVHEKADNDWVYLLKINDFKIADQTSPLPFVRDQIADIILNKRKMEVLNRLETELYREAEEKKTFEVLAKQPQ
jgi:hypothetical protein